MLEKTILYIGIMLMAYGGSALATKFSVTLEVSTLVIGLLLIGNANFLILNKRIKLLEVKSKNDQ